MLNLVWRMFFSIVLFLSSSINSLFIVTSSVGRLRRVRITPIHMREGSSLALAFRFLSTVLFSPCLLCLPANTGLPRRDNVSSRMGGSSQIMGWIMFRSLVEGLCLLKGSDALLLTDLNDMDPCRLMIYIFESWTANLTR